MLASAAAAAPDPALADSFAPAVEMLSHHAPLSRVYSGSTVNVDLGRLYQLDIVTMRVFDVLACGGCLLAERSPELAALFAEGEHLDGWSSPDELVAKTARWLADPAGARALGARGRAHVLAHHTVGHRVDAMLSFGDWCNGRQTTTTW